MLHIVEGFVAGAIVTVLGLAILFRSRFRYGAFAGAVELILNLHI